MQGFRSHRLRRLGLLMPLLLLACGSSTAPAPPGPQVSGQLEVAASLTDDSGIETGRRTVTDLTGVPVQLVRNDSVVATVLSAGGRFRFFAVAAGSYVIRLPEPGLAAFTLPVTVATASVELVTPLRVEPSTALLTAPNPCTRTEGLAIYRNVPVAGTVQADVLTLGFESIFPVTTPHPASLFHVHWLPEFVDPAGMYWVRVRTGGTDTVELVFLDS